MRRLPGILKSRLKSGRFRHSEGVAQCAARLARRHGVSLMKVELAAWLHDPRFGCLNPGSPGISTIDTVLPSSATMSPPGRRTLTRSTAVSVETFVTWIFTQSQWIR